MMAHLRKLTMLAPIAPIKFQKSLAVARRAARVRDWPHAIDAYRKAVFHRSNVPNVWIQYAHAQKELGSLELAEPLYRRAVAEGPRQPDSYRQLGHLLLRLGRSAEARPLFLRALVLDPGD